MQLNVLNELNCAQRGPSAQRSRAWMNVTGYIVLRVLRVLFLMGAR